MRSAVSVEHNIPFHDAYWQKCIKGKSLVFTWSVKTSPAIMKDMSYLPSCFLRVELMADRASKYSFRTFLPSLHVALHPFAAGPLSQMAFFKSCLWTRNKKFILHSWFGAVFYGFAILLFWIISCAVDGCCVQTQSVNPPPKFRDLLMLIQDRDAVCAAKKHFPNAPLISSEWR